MKLHKRLYINNTEMNIVSNTVSLKLSLGSVAVFTIKSKIAPKKHENVRFDIGYKNIK